jgi:hypothetical protein
MRRRYDPTDAPPPADAPQPGPDEAALAEALREMAAAPKAAEHRAAKAAHAAARDHAAAARRRFERSRKSSKPEKP